MNMRYREIGGFIPGRLRTDSHLWLDCANSSFVQSASSVNECMTGRLKTFRDVVTPHFRRRQRNGEIIINPMTMVDYESLPETGEGRHVRYRVPLSCSGVNQYAEWKDVTSRTTFLVAGAYAFAANWHLDRIPVTGALSEADVAAAIQEASTKVMAQRGMSDNNLFESLAEANQTAQMISKPMKSVTTYLNKVTPKALALTGSSAWLVYRYGLRPLIKDITGVLEGVGQQTGRRRKTSRAKVSISRLETIVKPSATFGGHYALVQLQKEDKVVCRAMSIDEYIADLASNIGFTGKGLLGTPWEIIPYSFVVDWFVNVGDFLYALMPTPSYKQLGSCIVIHRTMSNVYSLLNTIEDPTNTTWDLLGSPSGSVIGRRESKVRQPLAAPSLVVKADFRLDNLVRQADAASLIAVTAERLFGGRKKFRPSTRRTQPKVTEMLPFN